MGGATALVRRYYLYTATLSAGFVYPITTQYQLARGLSYGEVGLVGAVFMTVWVLAEVPTGYLGDAVGRRRVLVGASALNAAVLVGLSLATDVLGFVVATAGWAVAYSMQSGAGSAWLYDQLDARLDADAYARVKGRGVALLLAVTAAASLVGGALARVDVTYPYLLNGLWMALGVGVLATLPDADRTDGDSSTPPVAASLRRVLGRPSLRRFVCYYAVFVAFFEVVDLYLQPVAVGVGLDRADLGVLYAAFYVVAALVAVGSGRIRARLGARGWFLAVLPAVAGVFVVAAVRPVLALPGVLLLKTAGRVSEPLMEGYVNDRLGSDGRATGVSTVTMVAGAAAVASRLLAGWTAGVVGPTLTLALFGGGTAALLVGLRVLANPFERPDPDGRGRPQAADD